MMARFSGRAEANRGVQVSADAALTVAAGCWIGWLLLQLLDFGFGRDQGIFAVVGRTILERGMPYRDAWDFKPPGIFFVYALAGASVRGIRIVEVAAWISLVFAFRRVSQIYLGSPVAGTLGAMVAVAAHVQLEFWHTAQPESFGAVAIAWAVVLTAGAVCATDLSQTSRVARMFVSGLCYGVAALLKPTMGVAVLGSLAVVLIGGRRRDDAGSRPLVPAVALAFGALVPGLICIAFFAARGALPQMVHALVGFAPHYTALAWRSAQPIDVAVNLVWQWLFEYSLLIPIGLVSLLAARWTRELRAGLLHLGGVVACLLAGVLIQGKLFAYHFDAVLPLTALAAGWGLWVLWERSRRWTAGVAAFGALVVTATLLHDRSPDFHESFSQRSAARVAAWLTPARAGAIRDRLYSVADYRAGDNRRAADWIRAETSPDAAVFIYGFTPELYIASNRRLASRYIYIVPQKATWSRLEARSRLLDELRQSRPAAFLVEHEDVMPWVDGTLNDSAGDLERFDELKSVIGAAYQKEQRVGKFDVYRRTR
jgi:hypothetical protein